MVNKLKLVLEKLRRLAGIGLAAHIVIGLGLLLTLLLLSDVSIGEGRFDQFVGALETFNFKWWLLGLGFLLWVLPIAVAVTWRRTKAAGVEIDLLREKVLELLENRSIPVTVDIDERIPVTIADAMLVPVALETNIALDSHVDIETEVPIRTEVPLDTIVETKVFGIGRVKIPIRAKVPLDFVVPIAGRLRIQAEAVPISLDEEARIQLPPFDVPLRCRVETRIDILSNLEATGLLKD
jgi:hypothetical protein